MTIPVWVILVVCIVFTLGLRHNFKKFDKMREDNKKLQIKYDFIKDTLRSLTNIPHEESE